MFLVKQINVLPLGRTNVWYLNDLVLRQQVPHQLHHVTRIQSTLCVHSSQPELGEGRSYAFGQHLDSPLPNNSTVFKLQLRPSNVTETVSEPHSRSFVTTSVMIEH